MECGGQDYLMIQSALLELSEIEILTPDTPAGEIAVI
jgi:hypothetical protein